MELQKFLGKMFEIKVELFVLNHDWWLWWVGEDSDSLSRRPGIGMISGIAHVDSFRFRNIMPVADAQNPDIRCQAGRRQSGSTLLPPSTPGTLSLVLTRSSSTLFSGSDSLGHTISSSTLGSGAGVETFGAGVPLRFGGSKLGVGASLVRYIGGALELR